MTTPNLLIGTYCHAKGDVVELGRERALQLFEGRHAVLADDPRRTPDPMAARLELEAMQQPR